MATKTWKLGELSRGGVITVNVKGSKVTVIAKDWDTTNGYSRNKSQANAKEWDRLEVNLNNNGAESALDNYLFDLTTSYYTDNIMEWIKSKVTKHF